MNEMGPPWKCHVCGFEADDLGPFYTIQTGPSVGGGYSEWKCQCAEAFLCIGRQQPGGLTDQALATHAFVKRQEREAYAEYFGFSRA